MRNKINEETFVFTHSGYRLPQHLKQSIKFCRSFNPHAQIILIANPELRVNSDIRSLCTLHIVEEKQFQKLKTKLNFHYQDQEFSQNGFWFKSILRFLFIEAWVTRSNYEVGDFIHLESDCISFINKEIYADIRNNHYKISVPVDISGSCIPSVVYFPSGNHAINFSKYIKSRIEEASNLPEFYCNDIAMLNEFKDNNKVDSLPSLPVNDIKNNGKQIIFDPAYIGEYLLGKDVRHNNFILSSGSISRSEYIPIVRSMKFDLKSSEKTLYCITLVYDDREYTIANIHNYSKRFDLYGESIRIDQLHRIINEVNARVFTKRIKISYFVYFLIDKIEYNLRKFL